MSFQVRILLLFFWNRASRVPGWLWTYCVAEDHLEHLILLPLHSKYWDYRCNHAQFMQCWRSNLGPQACQMSTLSPESYLQFPGQSFSTEWVWLVNVLCLDMCVPQGCDDGCSICFYYALMDIVWLSCGQSVLEDKSELLYTQPPWVLGIFQHGLSKLSLRTEGLSLLSLSKPEM